MKIVSIVGTRPNFMKIASLVDEIKKTKNVKHILVHTGQHYDNEMSKLFFKELKIPKPDINLEVGSGTYGEQIANIIVKLEKFLKEQNPDLVIVVGDVNSTFAGALIAKQLGVKVAHVEAGLRSFDLSMPEEINRMLTDRISDMLFTTEGSGNKNLINEGINKKKIFFVGNVMIDTLLKHKKESEKSGILKKLNLKKENYTVLTLHRPGNVDNKKNFENVLSILDGLQKKIKIVFPMHPRTRKNIMAFGLNEKISRMENLLATEPLGYLDFLHLMSNSKLVLTDSGGIQEETTVLGVPCITLRNTTERPVTVEQGTNAIVSTEKAKILKTADKILKGVKFKSRTPKFWDGKASKRIVKIILNTGK